MTSDLVMKKPHERNRFALRREDLLADYAAISAKRRGVAESSALRLRSRQLLDIMAFEATHEQMDWKQLRTVLASPTELLAHKFDPVVLAEIGRVLLLQQSEADETALGVAALEYGIDGLRKNARSRRFRRLLVEHYVLEQDYRKSLELLDSWPDINREFHQYLRAELSNPFFMHDGGDMTDWLQNFNREFELHDLAPISLRGAAESPFDRLAVDAPAAMVTPDMGDSSGPVVSVIVTTFNPERAELLTAVQSILSQTLSNIEVIVVDDASAEQYRNNIVAVGELDERVRIVHAAVNGGTYRARNLGLSMSTGEYVTGQDDDDWSHPNRLAEQVEFLQEHPDVIGCRVSSIACSSNLNRVRLGYSPMSQNASSLMMKRETFNRVGGFMEARKAADTELHRRVEKITGRSVVDIAKPLAIVRIEADSLSRSEFQAGWSHPARREFKFSYAYWHSSASKSELTLTAQSTPQVCIPRRFRVDKDSFPARLDVVFAGDWRQYSGSQRSMLDEIRALTFRGFKIGVMQLESPFLIDKGQTPLSPHIQALINDGTVVEILYDDPVTVDLFILRHPPILQFAPVEPSALQIRKMMIVANQAPSALDGSDVRYLVPDCTANARAKFCENVVWAPQGPQTRMAIEPYLEPDELIAHDFLGSIDPHEWRANRSHNRSALPVVGRDSQDDEMNWPEHPAVIEKVYPTSGFFDVRILGGSKVPQTVLGSDVVPGGWTVYDYDSMPGPMFLETLDFYVLYQHSIAVETLERSILEAMASGLVVILPPSYSDVFGDAAVYADADMVRGVVMKLHSDRELYLRQVRTSDAAISVRFSHEAYGRQIAGIMEGTRI